jgi:hypothetical protein
MMVMIESCDGLTLAHLASCGLVAREVRCGSLGVRLGCHRRLVVSTVASRIPRYTQRRPFRHDLAEAVLFPCAGPCRFFMNLCKVPRICTDPWYAVRTTGTHDSGSG